MGGGKEGNRLSETESGTDAISPFLGGAYKQASTAPHPPPISVRSPTVLRHVRRGCYRRFEVLLRSSTLHRVVNFWSAQGNRPRSHFISARNIQGNGYRNLTHAFARAGCFSYRTSRDLANRPMRHASFIRTTSEPLANSLHRTDEAAFTRAIQSVPAKYGHLDALVLNAAILGPTTRIISTDTPLDAWRTHFEVNVFSLVTALKAAAPSLRESPNGGKVIFVSSGAAVRGVAGWGPYSASKAAMNSLNW